MFVGAVLRKGEREFFAIAAMKADGWKAGLLLAGHLQRRVFGNNMIVDCRMERLQEFTTKTIACMPTDFALQSRE